MAASALPETPSLAVRDPQPSLAGALAILPARNEAPTIGPVVEGLQQAGLSRILVLDDASTDRTAEIARRAGAEVRSFARRQGKTTLLRHALARLPQDVDWIFFLDADGQHCPLDLPRFWNARRDGDCLIGNRWADCQQMPPGRRIVNRLMSATLNALAGGDCPDTQCGYRLVRRSLLEGWLPRGSHFEFESELYLHALRQKARIVSVPIRAVYGSERSKIFWPRDTWRFLWCLRLVFSIGR